jgi:hypothetical protein
MADIPPLGILVLDTTFPRIVGDVGNPATWPFPTILRTVPQASPIRVAAQKSRGLVEAFVAAGHELVAQGAAGIITTCGFLVLHQRRLAEALPVPVATSNLLQYQAVARLLPEGRRVGVITYSREFLTPEFLAAAGAPVDTPVEGVSPDGVFFNLISHGAATLDFEAMKREVVDAARRLVARHPEVGALLIECANMPPYSAAVRAATGLPVFDAFSFFMAFYASLEPATFGHGPS